MEAKEYAVQYATHLYTLSGGSLVFDGEIPSEGIFQGTWLLRCRFRYDGKAYMWSFMWGKGVAQLCLVDVVWHDIARSLLESLKELKGRGCEYAIPEIRWP